MLLFIKWNNLNLDFNKSNLLKECGINSVLKTCRTLNIHRDLLKTFMKRYLKVCVCKEGRWRANEKFACI